MPLDALSGLLDVMQFALKRCPVSLSQIKCAINKPDEASTSSRKRLTIGLSRHSTTENVEYNALRQSAKEPTEYNALLDTAPESSRPDRSSIASSGEAFQILGLEELAKRLSSTSDAVEVAAIKFIQAFDACHAMEAMTEAKESDRYIDSRHLVRLHSRAAQCWGADRLTTARDWLVPTLRLNMQLRPCLKKRIW